MQIDIKIEGEIASNRKNHRRVGCYSDMPPEENVMHQKRSFHRTYEKEETEMQDTEVEIFNQGD